MGQQVENRNHVMALTLFEDAPPPVSPLPVNTEPWKQYGPVTLYLGDNIPILRAMPANSVDAVVTDSPYGLGFMGKEWDTFTPEKVASNKRKAFRVGRGDRRISSSNPNVDGRSRTPAMSPSQIEYDRSVEGQRAFQLWCFEWARECFRVLKPGGHMLACGAPRSSHRMVCGIEDAGFEIRDCIAWLFGQGFPKSHNLEGEWDGWGTALKPGHEPICVARKPFNSTVEENVERWGVGALNIDRCRLEVTDDAYARNASGDRGHDDNRTRNHEAFKMTAGSASDIGRWPPNVALDAQAASRLDAQAGTRKSGANPTRRGGDKFRKVFGSFKGEESCAPARGEEAGGASRFFFCPKPSRLERDFGCESLPHKSAGECTDRKDGSAGLTPYAGAGRSGGGKNPHPTVKPVNLMRWLIWLVTPAGGIVLDPFLGSGTTGMAAVVDGYEFIGIEREEEYLCVADARIEATRG
jgi:DNA modification methylase